MTRFQPVGSLLRAEVLASALLPASGSSTFRQPAVPAAQEVILRS